MNVDLLDEKIQKKSVYRLFLVVFYWELFLGLFPVWSGSIIYKYFDPRFVMSVWLFTSLLTYLLISFLIILYQKKLYNRVVVFTICLLYLFFVISIALNGFKSGGLALWGIPLSYFVLFDLLGKYEFPRCHINFVSFLLIIWCVAPFFYYILAPFHIKMTFFTGLEGQNMTFSGFAFHRNFYGIFIGITIILSILARINIVLKGFILICLSLVLYLSACRTAMIAVPITLLYLFMFNPKIKKLKKIALFIFSIIFSGILYYFTTNPNFALRRATDNNDREEIWNAFIKIITENPFWGVGKEATYYSPSFPEGVIAHNFILQTTANYGIFVLLLFLLLLLEVFYYSKFYFRGFLVYIIIWGLFQPYFGFTIPSVHIFIPLFIGHLLDNSKKIILN